MALVTITSDLGTRDFYLAALKGALLTHCGTVQLIDVSHAVKPFDIKEAAFLIRNAYHYFPKGTIHLVHVNAGNENPRLLVTEVNGHYFITFDNGIISLAFDKMPDAVYQVNDELLEKASLLHEDAIAKVIELLLKDYRPSDFGHLVTDTVSYRLLQPISSKGSIKGTVIYIDHFGNAVVNITSKLFDEFIGDSRFTVFANVGTTKTISNSYSDTEEGDMVCIFNSEGYLEVAINKGKAELLLGLKTDSSVLIFTD
ncbi:MAG: SAM-dependent chlorinase/fluorinase [Bacteroidota bacterium]